MKTPLLNASACRALALEYSRAHRAGKFSRVSGEFLGRLNARLKEMIQGEVQRHPTVGKTLK